MGRAAASWRRGNFQLATKIEDLVLADMGLGTQAAYQVFYVFLGLIQPDTQPIDHLR